MTSDGGQPIDRPTGPLDEARSPATAPAGAPGRLARLDPLRRLLRRRWARGILVLTVASGLAVLATVAALTIDGVTDSTPPSDVVIVLGNRVAADGTPAPRLAARLDAAIEVLETGRVEYVIVSGGVGRSGADESVAMADYLVAAGIDRDRIVLDGHGVNTRATAENSARIMSERGWETAIVATQYFHVSRAKLALDQAGIDMVGSIHADHVEIRDGYSVLREVPAWIAYRLRLDPPPSSTDETSPPSRPPALHLVQMFDSVGSGPADQTPVRAPG